MTALAEKRDIPEVMGMPKMLIYEELNGRQLYRKGYKKFLNRTKTIEEIMGCSSLQAAIVSVFLSYLYRHVEDEGYEIMTNEAGLHISLGNNLSSDIIVYDSEDFLKYHLDDHYFNVAPKIVIEVDIKIELEEDMDPKNYWIEKTKVLFDFGVEKVVWVFTEGKHVIIAEPDQPLRLYSWKRDFELLPNHVLNLQERIDKKGYQV